MALGIGKKDKIDIVDRAMVAIAIDQIQQLAADAFDGRNVEFHRPELGRHAFRTQLQRALIDLRRITHPKCHGVDGRAMNGGKRGGVAVWFGVEDEIDAALAIQRDIFGAVAGDRGKAHRFQYGGQRQWIKRGEFDEVEAIGTHGALLCEGDRYSTARFITPRANAVLGGSGVEFIAAISQFVIVICENLRIICTNNSICFGKERKMSTITVDRFDLALLTELQRDGHITNSALGQKVHLSTSQISRRVQRLEEAHVIERYTAVLDPAVVGLGVTAFTNVTLDRQGETRGDQFEKAVQSMPEIMECFSITGEADYILRIVAPDLAAFSELMMTRLLRLPGVTNVKSNITMKQIKHSHVLPLDHVTQPAQSRQRIKFSS